MGRRAWGGGGEPTEPGGVTKPHPSSAFVSAGPPKYGDVDKAAFLSFTESLQDSSGGSRVTGNPGSSSLVAPSSSAGALSSDPGGLLQPPHGPGRRQEGRRDQEERSPDPCPAHVALPSSVSSCSVAQRPAASSRGPATRWGAVTKVSAPPRSWKPGEAAQGQKAPVDGTPIPPCT